MYTVGCSPARLVQNGRAHRQKGCELWASMTEAKWFECGADLTASVFFLSSLQTKVWLKRGPFTAVVMQMVRQLNGYNCHGRV